ncbi:MAG: sigma-70 RNA polymerase sigma factor region 4 domain-containing protein [Planctomycetota bacterium]
MIRSYLGDRWRGSPLLDQLDDAAQEVFLACFRDESPLHKAGPEWDGGFRAFLFGVVRNVARGFEKKRTRSKERAAVDLDAFTDDADPVSKVFDRAWAISLMQQAARRQADQAARKGPESVLRVKLLRLRFQEGKPIREIARLWEMDPARLHREYATARNEFQAALADVVRLHQGGGAKQIEAECLRLLEYFD